MLLFVAPYLRFLPRHYYFTCRLYFLDISHYAIFLFSPPLMSLPPALMLRRCAANVSLIIYCRCRCRFQVCAPIFAAALLRYAAC